LRMGRHGHTGERLDLELTVGLALDWTRRCDEGQAPLDWDLADPPVAHHDAIRNRAVTTRHHR
ncbi:MAG: hypothetical protein AAGB05_15485, partial [Pseudomonadota bacterium]